MKEAVFILTYMSMCVILMSVFIALLYMVYGATLPAWTAIIGIPVAIVSLGFAEIVKNQIK